MNSADLDVLPAADRLRQHRVGDVADQHVLERVLALAGEPAAGAGDEQVLLLERGERLAEVEPLLGRRRGERSLPEGLAHHRRLTGAGGARRRSSESSRAASSDCTVSGSAAVSTVSSSSSRLTISSANSGLPPERSATCGTTPAAPFPELGISAATSSRVSFSVSGSREIVVALRRPPPQPGRRSSSSSRARQTSSSGAAHPAGQVLDQVEHSLVGPVDVLDREHQRTTSVRSPRRRRGRRRRALSRIRCGSALRLPELLRRLEAEQDGRAGRHCARRTPRPRARSSARSRRSGASPRRRRARRCRAIPNSSLSTSASAQ